MQAAAHRILIVLPDLRRGGGQSVLLQLAGAFLDAGREVHLACLLDDGPLRSMVPAGVKLHALSNAHRSGGVLLSLSALPRLVAGLRDIAPGAVLSSMSGTNLLTALACRTAHCGARLVLREASSMANAAGTLKQQAMRRLYRRADALIAVSVGVAGDLRGLGLSSKRIHVIHNPVDAERLRGLASTAPPWPDGNTPYVISIGRLTEAKDYPTLLRAYAISGLRNSHRLVIVGGGEQRGQTERLVEELGIADRVLLTGDMENPYHVLAGAGLFVLSSRWEGYPNVLLEAMALGVPIVSTDCDYGPAELLDGGRCGRLVPVGDVEALARAMESELERPPSGFQTVLDAHRPQHVASRYLAVLDGGDAGNTP